MNQQFPPLVQKMFRELDSMFLKTQTMIDQTKNLIKEKPKKTD